MPVDKRKTRIPGRLRKSSAGREDPPMWGPLDHLGRHIHVHSVRHEADHTILFFTVSCATLTRIASILHN
jgi:hypothetical protein